MRERILEAEAPSRIAYSVISGPFPVSKHYGDVTFTAAKAPATGTLVSWRCTFTPSFWGSVFMCRGVGLGWFIRTVFRYMLRNLAAHFSATERTALKPKAE